MDSSKMDEFVANAALLAAHLKEKCEQAAASQQASAQDLQGAAIVVRKTIEEGKRELVEHAGSAVSSALSEKVPAATQAILDTAARLKADVEGAGMTMMHEYGEWDNKVQMMEALPISLTKGKKVEFKPGALHVMAMEPPATWKPGDKVKVTLTMSGGTTQVFEAEVRAAGEER